METKEYRTVDKSAWPRGEWDDEPDKMQWQDEATKLPCLIVRASSGALCGYVGVSPSHPWYKLDYSDVFPGHACNDSCEKDGSYHDYESCIDGRIEVHGGLTFADMCADTSDESKHICHVPGPGEPDHVWWFGFDCAHSGDISPAYGMHRMFSDGYDSYREIPYVKREVTRLAEQLKRASESENAAHE